MSWRDNAWEPAREIPGMLDALQTVPRDEWTFICGHWVLVSESGGYVICDVPTRAPDDWAGDRGQPHTP